MKLKDLIITLPDSNWYYRYFPEVINNALINHLVHDINISSITDKLI